MTPEPEYQLGKFAEVVYRIPLSIATNGGGEAFSLIHDHEAASRRAIGKHLRSLEDPINNSREATEVINRLVEDDLITQREDKKYVLTDQGQGFAEYLKRKLGINS